MQSLFRTTLASGAAAVLLMGAAMAGDDEERTTKTIDLTDFDRIEISGVYDLTVEAGEDYSIKVSGSAREIDRIEASVSDGVLELSQKKKNSWRRKQHGVDAVITMPTISGLEVSGVVDGTVSGIDVERFNLAISGVGDVTLSGRCDQLEASVSGVGDLDADGLECRDVEIRVSGVGDASVYASESVDATVSGMGDIDVYGKPENVTKSDSMFAEVTVH